MDKDVNQDVNKDYLIKQVKDGDRIISEAYKFRNAIVEVVAPPPMTEEEIQKVLDDMHNVAWKIIEDLVAKGDRDVIL